MSIEIVPKIIERNFVVEPNHVFLANLCTFMRKNKTPMDISLWVFKVGMSSRIDVRTDYLEFAAGSGLTKEGSSLKMSIPTTVVNSLAGRTMFYDLRCERPGQNVWYIMSGTLKFNRRIVT